MKFKHRLAIMKASASSQRPAQPHRGTACEKLDNPDSLKSSEAFVENRVVCLH